MGKPTLKIELIDGLQVIRCRKEDLDWEAGKSLSICIPDFRGQAGDPIRNVISIEWYDGKIQVRLYDGDEEPTVSGNVSGTVHFVEPDPVLTEAVYCPKEDLPKLLSSDDETVLEIVEQRLKENK